MTHNQLFDLLLLITTAYALVRGGSPERMVALIFIAAGVLMPFVVRPLLKSYQGPEIGEVAIDVAMYVGLLAIALHANRFWPVWMSALQGVQVMTHLLGLVEMPAANTGYAMLAHFLGYPMTILLLVATWMHRRRLSKRGADASWSVFSARSTGIARRSQTG